MNRAHGLLLALALAALEAGAQIHMCKDANGRKVFSQESCGPDATVVDVRPAMGGPTINPSTSIQVQYYDVRGSTWEELVRDIKAKGPEGWWGNAQTGIRYEMTTREVSDGCVVGTAQVRADSRVRLPTWGNRHDASRDLQVFWDGALRTLDLHERGHVSISIEGAKEIERSIKEIPKQPTCLALKTEARRRYDELNAAVVKRQSVYDLTTNHGLQQWTPYKDKAR